MRLLGSEVSKLFIFFHGKILHAKKHKKNTRHQKVPKSTISIKTEQPKKIDVQVENDADSDLKKKKKK